MDDGAKKEGSPRQESSLQNLTQHNLRRLNCRKTVGVKILAVLALLLTIFVSCRSDNPRRDSPVDPVVRQHLEVIDRIRNTIVTVHPDPFHAISKNDFDALYHEIRAACSKPMSVVAFYFQAARLVAAIKDSHSSLKYVGVKKYLPLRLVWASDGLGILDTTNEYSRIRYGRLLSIEGIPVDELLVRLASVIPAVSDDFIKGEATTLLLNQSFLKGLLRTEKLETLRVQVSKGAQTLSESLPFSEEYILQGAPLAWEYWQDDAALAWYDWRIIPEISAGYFKIKACRDTPDYRKAAADFFAAVKQSACDNVIIDLRGNTGGTTEAIDAFLFKMPGDNFSFYKKRIRVSLPTVQRILATDFGLDGCRISCLTPYFGGRKRKKRSDRAQPPFSGKIYLLVDHDTFSSGSGFAAVFKKNRLATVIGEEIGDTISSFGEPIGLSLLSRQLVLKVCYAQFTWPDNADHKGERLVPDVVIPRTLDDFFTGRDPHLEWLFKTLGNSGSD